MPTYTYKCDKCGHVFEMQGVPMACSDSPNTCPECGAKAERTMESLKTVGIKVRW